VPGNGRDAPTTPIAFITFDLLELKGRDIRGEPQRERRRKLEALAGALFAEGRHSPLRVSPEVIAKSWEAMDVVRQQARGLGREGLMLKAREGAYGSAGVRAAIAWMSGGSGNSIR
jgi:DNA ligase-1